MLSDGSMGVLLWWGCPIRSGMTIGAGDDLKGAVVEEDEFYELFEDF